MNQMKITLSQVEIEQAIRTYVGETLTLATGTHIEIELSTPRGSTEVNAVIDLRNEPVTAPVVKATTPKPVHRTVVVPAAAQELRDTFKAKGREPDVEADTEPMPQVHVSLSEPQPEPVPEPVPEQVPTTPKNLFGNLKRPNNQ